MTSMGGGGVSFMMAPFWKMDIVDCEMLHEVSQDDIDPDEELVKHHSTKRSKIGFRRLSSKPFLLEYRRGFPWIGRLLGKSEGRPAGALLMSNHQSFADGFLLRAVTLNWISDVLMVYKKDLDSIPLFGWTFKLTGDLEVCFKSKTSFAVEKGTVGRMMERARVCVCDDKMSIGVFPEGAAGPGDALQRFRDGFFRFAVENEVPVYPMAIHGSKRCWPSKSKWMSPGTISILRSVSPITVQKGKTAEELKAEVCEAIERLLEVGHSIKDE